MVQLPENKSRNLYLIDEVTAASCRDVASAINNLNAEDREMRKYIGSLGGSYTPPPIILHIDSYGGGVYQGLGLYDVIRSSDTPVTTIVEGMAMSAGMLLLLAGENRFATENSTIMVHSMFDVIAGKTAELVSQVKWATEVQERLTNIMLERTKISKQKLDEVEREKLDWFMGTKEALTLGIIDGIL